LLTHCKKNAVASQHTRGSGVGAGVGGTGVGAGVGALVAPGHNNVLPRPSRSAFAVWQFASVLEQQSGCAASKLVNAGKFAAHHTAVTLTTHLGTLSSWQQPNEHAGALPSMVVHDDAKPVLQHDSFTAK
jgi:hypothetical protein